MPSQTKRNEPGHRPTRRSSEREPAVSLRDKSNVIGGWLPSLTLVLAAMGTYPPIVLMLVASLSYQLEQAGIAQEQPAGYGRRYYATAGSKVTLAGEGNIHNWKAEGTLIAGFLEVGPAFLGPPAGAPGGGKIEARAEVFIPVRNLKGVGSSWEPDNVQLTGIIHKMLHGEEHPKILFRLSELILKPARTSDIASREFASTGELIIAGVTNRISLTLQIAPLSGAKLKISGNTKLKQSDFHIVPKPNYFETMDSDMVTIAFEWIVALKGGQ
jgi:hypothetical protein